MNINLEYYKIFYYVAVQKSFTSAAEKLCITQPAVSQSIKLLEQNLGSSLFVRASKGVKLTPEGEALFSYISKGYEYIQLGEKLFNKMIDLEHGEIRIGASDMTLQFYLLPFLETFHKEHPKIKVTVTNGPTPETCEYLKDGKIDFGIVSTPLIEKDHIRITPVRELQDVFIANHRYFHLNNRTLEFDEVIQNPIICLEKNTSTRRYIDEFLKKNNKSLEPEFELATSDMIVQFALRGLGIGYVVEDFAKKYIESGEMIKLQVTPKIPTRHMCIITSESNPISTAAKSLLDMMI